MEKDKMKTSRASQTRAKAETKKVWTPPNSLDAPPAPTGYRHQWIRAEAVSNDLMKEQHPSMKFQKESNTRVTFGGTKKS
jgi:hypothetical protein